MRFVLLKMEDEAAERFVKKAGAKAVGVWEIPSREDICGCSEKQRQQAKNWRKDDGTGWWLCQKCGGVSKPFLSVGIRLKAALGKNIVKKFRD